MEKEETKYFVEEFASKAEVFGVTEDLIRAAFIISNKKEASISEAKEIVEKFKKQEVY